MHESTQAQYGTPGNKVLLAITKSNWGGAQRYVYDLAVGLSERGYDVIVAAGGDGPLLAKLREAHIPVEQLEDAQRDVSIGKDFRTLRELVRVVRRVRPDVLHVNSAKIGGLGVLAARLLRVPRVVFTLHGLAFNEERSWPSKMAIIFFTWLTIFLSHVSIAVSEALSFRISSWPFIKNKVVVVRNALTPATLLPRDEAKKELVGDKTFSPLIGTIAELHHIKGLEYMIRAMAVLRDEPAWANAGYVVMGEGDDRTRLEELIQDLGVADRVVLRGHVTDAARYLSALDVFVLPSLSEGLAYAALEAGAAGVPTIVSDVGGLPEVIESGCGLRIPPRDVRALVDALEWFNNDRGYAEACARRLRDSVTDAFSLDGMIEATLRAYRGR